MAEPGSPEELLQAALDALQRGRLRQGQNLLQACAATGDPDHGARANSLLADLAVVQGDLDDAERLARTAVDEGTGHGRSAGILSLGGVLTARGDAEGASQAYREAMSSAPPGIAAMAAFNMGVLLTTSGDIEGAKSAFATAIESDDPDAAPRAEVNLGILLAGEGDLPGATAVFQSAAARDNPEQRAKARLNLLVLKRRYREPGSAPAPVDPAERLYRIAELQTESARLLFASARNQRDPVLQLSLYVSLLELVDGISSLAATPDELACAVDPCRGAVRIGEMLAKRFALEPSHLTLGINAAGRLGDLHLVRDARKDACKWYARAHKAATRLAQSHPESAAGPLGAARSCWQLATLEEHPDRIRALVQESTSWLAKATERDPSHPELPYERSLVLWHLGVLDPADVTTAATQIIADFGPLEDHLPPTAAEALTWARANAREEVVGE
jgi:tetratricopeptide (TPR) repeat protein